ncbi:MAG: hypothetical protein KDA75_11680, partial [Planctomycetaceae bacterium]|nr:hypothetical protein [Planctomycetaceae bacterium]
MYRRLLQLLIPLAVLSGVLITMAAETPQADQRTAAKKLFDQGNWRDAYGIYSELALSSQNAGQPLADDFQQAITCLRNLQRGKEVDAFREQVIDRHAEDWRLLSAAARTLQYGDHYGFIVAG